MVDAIDMLSQNDFDQISIPALGHVYDIDRKIFHYLPKRLNGMVTRMWQQIVDKSDVSGAFRGKLTRYWLKTGIFCINLDSLLLGLEFTNYLET